MWAHFDRVKRELLARYSFIASTCARVSLPRAIFGRFVATIGLNLLSSSDRARTLPTRSSDAAGAYDAHWPQLRFPARDDV